MNFTVINQHVTLVKNLNITFNDYIGGAPGADPKRPYRSTSVEHDMFEILAIPPRYIDEFNDPIYYPEDYDYVRLLHRELDKVLQIFIDTGEIKTGVFEKVGNKWKRVIKNLEV